MVVKEGRMIFEKLGKLRDSTFLHKVTNFFDGDLYPILYAVLVLVCSFTGMEIAFFVLTAAVVLFTTLFCRDTKSIIVPLVMTVYGVSQMHTPQPPYGSDFLYRPSVLILMGCLFALVLAATIFRMAACKGTGNVFRTHTKARYGLFAMGAVLILNGLFYKEYTAANLLIGLALAFSFVYFYIYIYNTLEWTENTAVYVARVIALAGAVISVQFLELMLIDQPITKNDLVLGWGMSNNIGGMLAMFMPACFYLAYKCRAGLAYYILGIAEYAVVVRTLSRTALLVGAMVLVASIVLLCIRGRNVRSIRIFNIVLAVALLLCIVIPNPLWELVEHYIVAGFDDSGRYDIWLNGLKNFLRAPVFGVGFYTPIAPDYSYEIENWVFPDMYHNTFIQMLASCGIVGLAAYVFHVVQGMLLVFHKTTPERLFFFLVIFSLSAMSLLDNHLFHVFPTLVYSMLFALCEKDRENTLRALPLQPTGKISCDRLDA